MSGTYPDIDVTDQQEPDYLARFDKPIVLPCYEKWSKEHETTIEELNQEAEYYEHQRPF